MCWSLCSVSRIDTLPLAFLYVCGNGNHDIGGPFRHFGHFFVLNSFDGTICLNDQQDLVPILIVDQHFHSCQPFAALASATTKMNASIIAQTGGCSGS
jgi:hypothetical protein